MQMGILEAFEDPRSDELWIIGVTWIAPLYTFVTSP